MNVLRIKETCVYVKDLERIRSFYTETLGLPIINEVPGKHIFLRAGDSVLLIFNPDDSRTKTSPPGHYAEGKQHFAFEVPHDQYAYYRDLIRARGIQLIDEVTWERGAKSFYFNDPEGNILEILPDRGVWD